MVPVSLISTVTKVSTKGAAATDVAATASLGAVPLALSVKATLIKGTFQRDSKTETLPGTKVFTEGR
jgi:hypothetical protein